MELTRYEPNELTRRQRREVEGTAREAATAVYEQHIHDVALGRVYRAATDEVIKTTDYMGRAAAGREPEVQQAINDYRQQYLADTQRALLATSERVGRAIRKDR